MGGVNCLLTATDLAYTHPLKRARMRTQTHIKHENNQTVSACMQTHIYNINNSVIDSRTLMKYLTNALLVEHTGWTQLMRKLVIDTILSQLYPNQPP